MNIRKLIEDAKTMCDEVEAHEAETRSAATVPESGAIKVVDAGATGSLPAWMAHELIIAWENRMLKMETDRQRARVVNDYKQFSELTDKRDELLQCINDLRRKMERTD